jgi:hypothetical protein
MENKKDLAKIALAALILAAATPATGQADIEAHGIILAAGCAAHGCPAAKDSSSTANSSSYYNDSNQAATSTSNTSANLTEAQLQDMLSPQGKAIYQSLDPEGKALAIQLAGQDSYRDKNLAVKEAQRRMNERSGLNR